MKYRVGFFGSAVLALAVSGCAADSAPAVAQEDVGTSEAELSLSFLGVQFSDCHELASLTPISVADARSVVPSRFALGGDGTVAPFVVRVASCAGVSVDGSAAEPGTVAQLGVGIVSPDGTGDINNYTVWYYTTSLRLAVRLALLGVPAQWAPRLSFELSGTTLTIDVKHPNQPPFHVTSTVAPGSAPTDFSANWWRLNGARLTKMDTRFPGIVFGGGATTLTTPATSPLASLLGASTVSSFPFLDSYNIIPTAPMTVSVSKP